MENFIFVFLKKSASYLTKTEKKKFSPHGFSLPLFPLIPFFSLPASPVLLKSTAEKLFWKQLPKALNLEMSQKCLQVVLLENLKIKTFTFFQDLQQKLRNKDLALRAQLHPSHYLSPTLMNACVRVLMQTQTDTKHKHAHTHTLVTIFKPDCLKLNTEIHIWMSK